MTENQMIFSILGKVRPHLSDDVDLSPRQVAWDIATQRSLMIRNELNKTRTIDVDTIQDLGCVEMEIADPAECCEVSTGCKVVRTVLEIPSTIELHNSDAITRIGPVNKTLKEFSKTTFDAAKFVGNGKYTKGEIFAYRANNRIYLVSNNTNHLFIEHINIRGVFEDPKDVTPFTSCSDGGSCYSSDDNYPLKSWMYTYIETSLLQKYTHTYQLPADVLNDSTDNTVTDK